MLPLIPGAVALKPTKQVNPPAGTFSLSILNIGSENPQPAPVKIAPTKPTGRVECNVVMRSSSTCK